MSPPLAEPWLLGKRYSSTAGELPHMPTLFAHCGRDEGSDTEAALRLNAESSLASVADVPQKSLMPEQEFKNC